MPGTGLVLHVLRYFPHLQVPLERGPDGRLVGGAPQNASDEPLNPAVEVRLQAPGLAPRQRWISLPFEPGHPRDPIQYGKYLVGAVEFTPGYATILEFKTHPVMLPCGSGAGS